jgi:hypothetical protein
MIFMADTPQDFAIVSEELKLPVEQLITPLTRRKNLGGMWACDNGAYSRFSAKLFLAVLARNAAHRDRCRWVAMPDVVGSAIRTLELFEHWSNEQPLLDWPKALVAQDGQESRSIPWDEIDCIFIGGTTEWKASEYAMQIAKAGVAMGKWVHVGRVNTPLRAEKWSKLASSIDGTGLARYSHMRKALTEPRLFDAVETVDIGSAQTDGEVAV